MTNSKTNTTTPARKATTVSRREKLNYVPFGRTGWQVSEVCAGTMTWGSFNGAEEEAWAQLDKLVEMGVNFIDTAELYPVAFNYGKTTELWIGNWLSKRVAEGKVDRDSIYIATKCNAMGIGASLEGRVGKPHGYDEEMLEHSCRASLDRLQCGVIDLYQLHFPSRDMPLFGCAQFFPEGKNRPFPFTDMGKDTETGPASVLDGGMNVFERQVRAVKKLLDKGLIKHWGLSNENAYGITMFCLAADRLGVPRPVSCQNDFSLINRTYECDTWEAAYRFGVVGLPYGPLGGGVLTGKYFDGSRYASADPGRPLSECRLRKCKEFQPRYGMPVPMLATAKYVALAEEYGITPTELALAWARQRDCNTSVIIGTTTVRQVEECVNAFKLDLPHEVMDKVDAIHEEFRNPSMYYTDKDVCMKAKFLGVGAWHACERRPRFAAVLRAPETRIAIAAAASALAVYALMKTKK